MFSYKRQDLKYIAQDFTRSAPSALDAKLEIAFTDAMEAGLLRYKQPKASNNIKVCF